MIAGMQVSAGWKHSCGTGHAGQLYGWGWGGSVGSTTSLESGRSSGGQLGLGDEFDYWAPTQVADLQTAARQEVSAGQNAPVWNAVQVSCGFNHTAAVIEIDDRNMSTWT